MYFDTLAGIVERHLPEFIPILKQASIFRAECRHEGASVTDAIESWHPDERTIENFRLPFQTVAIERCETRQGSSDGCTIFSIRDAESRLFDVLSASHSGQNGNTLISRATITALPNVEQALDDPLQIQSVSRLESAMELWYGDKKRGLLRLYPQLEIDADIQVHAKHGAALIENGTDWSKPENQQRIKEKIAELNRSIAESESNWQKLQGVVAYLYSGIGVLSLLAINEPARFVVEERPLKEPKSPPTMIPRSMGRPHFIVLEPRQIRQRFIYPSDPEEEEKEDEGRHVTPHERRGHYRTMRSERFKNARGQVLWIKPMWVGPSEGILGHNRYKVRLDL